MPRKRKLRFVKKQNEAAGTWPMLVASVGPRGDGWLVTLTHLGGARWGCKQELHLPPELPPSGAWAHFFRAAGLHVDEGVELDPQEAEGRVVNAVFSSAAGGEPVIVGFAKTQEEASHESDEERSPV